MSVIAIVGEEPQQGWPFFSIVAEPNVLGEECGLRTEKADGVAY